MRQEAGLTFKQNRHHGRHGWVRLTPAYSVKVVEGVFEQFGGHGTRVFEPFGGTGTTALCAANRGLDAVSLDINPFLVWLGRVKTGRYDRRSVTQFERAAQSVCDALIGEPLAVRGRAPPIRNIERWWSKTELGFLSALFHDVSGFRGRTRDLLQVAFCRTMISLSNAAFNHQSMSFGNAEPKQRGRSRATVWRACVEQFRSDVSTVAASASENPTGSAHIELADSRTLGTSQLSRGPFDLLVTSPPYPNRMSYVRELRPYMYWLGHLKCAKDAGALDWAAIGGTWGIATSRLSSWEPTTAYVPRYLSGVLGAIRRSPSTHGDLMARYVHKYFDDMFHHFSAVMPKMRPGGSVHYIVGNSTFYGHLVPTERIFVDQLSHLGFKKARATPLRKRNSKRELFEYHVVAEC